VLEIDDATAGAATDLGIEGVDVSPVNWGAISDVATFVAEITAASDITGAVDHGDGTVTLEGDPAGAAWGAPVINREGSSPPADATRATADIALTAADVAAVDGVGLALDGTTAIPTANCDFRRPRAETIGAQIATTPEIADWSYDRSTNVLTLTTVAPSGATGTALALTDAEALTAAGVAVGTSTLTDGSDAVAATATITISDTDAALVNRVGLAVGGSLPDTSGVTWDQADRAGLVGKLDSLAEWSVVDNGDGTLTITPTDVTHDVVVDQTHGALYSTTGPVWTWTEITAPVAATAGTVEIDLSGATVAELVAVDGAGFTVDGALDLSGADFAANSDPAVLADELAQSSAVQSAGWHEDDGVIRLLSEATGAAQAWSVVGAGPLEAAGTGVGTLDATAAGTDATSAELRVALDDTAANAVNGVAFTIAGAAPDMTGVTLPLGSGGGGVSALAAELDKSPDLTVTAGTDQLTIVGPAGNVIELDGENPLTAASLALGVVQSRTEGAVATAATAELLLTDEQAATVSRVRLQLDGAYLTNVGTLPTPDLPGLAAAFDAADNVSATASAGRVTVAADTPGSSPTFSVDLENDAGVLERRAPNSEKFHTEYGVL
jgi:hypothetical protein